MLRDFLYAEDVILLVSLFGTCINCS